jgi:uncharacterized membrane protein YeiH
MPLPLSVLDYLGIGVFAASGAILAAEKRTDLVTFCFFAVASGIGGGTLRDLLIGAPVFWVHQNGIFLICLAAALAVWLAGPRIRGGGALVWLDAVGLSAYAAYGAAKGLGFGTAPLPAFAMGVLTGCAGGIIRDLLANRPSILLRSELYVTAAALSAGLMVSFELAGVPSILGGFLAAVLGFFLRAAAILRNWSLPTYKS